MALNTSLKYKNIELNDWLTYMVPLADQQLDDPNSTDASWAYRKSNTPVQTGISIKEGSFALNISIKAVYGETPAQFEAKLNLLKQIFDTRDPAFYKLERKFPHEQYYRFLMVAPREVAINRIERKVSVTFQTADKTWQDGQLHTATQLMFETAARTENMVITYNGLFPVEPVVKVQALTPGSDGPVPLYFREVTLYSVGAGAAGAVTNNPVRLVTGWNNNTEVGAGKMRADGLDISVTLPDTTVLRRYVGGTQASRNIWINPQTWPYYAAGTLIDGPGAGAPLDPPQSHRSLLAGDNVVYFSMLGVEAWPQTGKFMLDNEVIGWTNATVTYQDATSMQVKLGGLQRGQDGTAAADHVRFTPMKRPVTLRVNYGYAAGYAQVFYNDLNGWPLINYEQSTNNEWVQTDTYDPNPTNRPWSWRADVDPKPVRAGEHIFSSPETQERQALWSSYFSGNYTDHHRLLIPTPGYATRMLDYIRLKLTLKGGPGAYPGITVKLMKLTRGYGTGYANESVKELWSYTHNSSAEAAIDTGYVFTDQRWTQGTHYFLRLENAAPGAQTRSVRVDEFRALLDTDYWMYYPIAGALGGERGPGTGEYPTNISWRNLSDPAQAAAFSLYTTQATGQQVTVDCAEHAVAGMTLQECSYTQTTWLRLLPGNNTIQFGGPQGAGQMQVTLEWRERT